MPVTHDSSSVATKTIYVRELYKDGKYPYMKYIVSNNERFPFVFMYGRVLVALDDPDAAIVDFNEVKDGKIVMFTNKQCTVSIKREERS